MDHDHSDSTWTYNVKIFHTPAYDPQTHDLPERVFEIQKPVGFKRELNMYV